MHALAAKIHPGPDVFVGVNPAPEGAWITNWGGDNELFKELIRERNPEVIVEVGSWRGESAITMGRLLAELGLDGAIICVDTWLGSAEHWNDPGAGGGLNPGIDGHPTVYRDFLANVKGAGLTETVIPFPISSEAGARYLGHVGIHPDLVYIDASHEYRTVLNDMEAYWEILAPGGTMFGHDIQMPGVRKAFKEFMLSLNVEATERNGCWIIDPKPQSCP